MKKITNEMIARCLADFNFDKVAKLYDFMGWKWRGKGIPTKSDIIDTATRIIYDLQDGYPKTSSISTGGLKASAYEEEGLYTVLELQFIAHTAIASQE